MKRVEHKSDSIRYARLALLVSAVFIVLHLFMVWNGGENEVFNSPDANANYHFAKRLYMGTSLAVPLSVEHGATAAYLSTRSSRVVNSSIVPVGFLGFIIISGLLAKFLFLNIIPYVTPVIAGFALFFFFKLLELTFSKHIALLSAVLLAMHPAWWYYTNDALVPNVLFAALAIMSFYYGAVALQRKKALHYILFAIFLALALFVRTSEVVWLAPVVFILSIINRRSINWYYGGIAVLIIASIAFAIMVLHGGVYGRSFSIGYNVVAEDATDLMHIVGQLVFPFGLHLRLVIRNIINYGLYLFWPFSLAALSAVVWISGRGLLRDQVMRLYVIVGAIISIILFVFYGTWRVVDNPDPDAITIGTSYVRYFLPVYIVSVPLIATTLVGIAGALKNGLGRLVTPATIVLLAWFSVTITMFSPGEGIFEKRRSLEQYDRIASWIRNNTPDESIFVTDKSDKYIWPHRLVMTVPHSDEAFEAVRVLRGTLLHPLYFIGVTMKAEGFDSQNRAWRRHGISIGGSIYTNADVSIYPISLLSDDD